MVGQWPGAAHQGVQGVTIRNNEFRNVGSFDMQITESLPRWDRIVETVRANSDTWKESAHHG